MKVLPLAMSLVLVLLCTAALAVDPDTSPQETTPTDVQRTTPEGGPRPFPEQVIVGMVTGSDDNPVGGVAVKLFADGILVEVSHTTTAGDYEMPMPLRIDENETVVLWFIDSAGTYPPQKTVLKKSSKAEGAGLFSNCAREAKMRPQMRVDIRLMTDSEMMASYVTSGCL